ncbi:MAG: hypothetical protein V4633_03875 [Pseudomonadota bacterium]
MIDIAAIVQFHDSKLAGREWLHAEPEPLGPGLWCWIYANHRYNSLLWHEDQRQRIACYRRRRLHARAAIDDALQALLAQPLPPGKAGAMIDRLSLLSLRIVHLPAQAPRWRRQRARLLAHLARLLAS